MCKVQSVSLPISIPPTVVPTFSSSSLSSDQSSYLFDFSGKKLGIPPLNHCTSLCSLLTKLLHEPKWYMCTCHWLFCELKYWENPPQNPSCISDKYMQMSFKSIAYFGPYAEWKLSLDQSIWNICTIASSMLLDTGPIIWERLIRWISTSYRAFWNTRPNVVK